MPRERHEVVVVGAGPGGATAAYHLGEGRIRQLRFREKGGDRPAGRGRASAGHARPLRPHILRHAQAEVREGTLMRQVVAGQHGALIETTDGKLLEADYVIGADGANSVVARSIGLRRDRTLVAALEAEVEVPAHVNRQFTRREPVGTARVLLVGDAAGLADPFSGEGIRFAVKSGRLAAQAVLKGEPQRYSDWLFHSIGRSHLRSLRVARFFYRFQRHCLELGAPNPFTTQMIAQLLADCAEPAQVMLWAVLTSPFYLGVEGVAGVTGLFTGAERGQRIRQALYQA